MVNQFDTSFIPQQPLLKIEGASGRRETINFALIIALIIFFTSIAVTAGLYVYRLQVDKRVLADEQALDAAEKYFSIDEINTYKRADVRLSVAKELVDNHTISSVVLDLLENSTAQNVGLTSFSFGKGDAGISISLLGQAPSYSGVYFQAESWRAMQPMIKSVEVSSMNLDDKTGIVAFGVSMNIDPQYLEFARVLAAQKRVQAGAAEVSLPQVVSPPPSPQTAATGTAILPATTTIGNIPKP